jgi:hypothetical protein
MLSKGGFMPELVNPAQVQKFLAGVDYPVSKQTLLDTAQSEGADENVLYTLEQLPERTYNGPNAVAEEIGRLE